MQTRNVSLSFYCRTHYRWPFIATCIKKGTEIHLTILVEKSSYIYICCRCRKNINAIRKQSRYALLKVILRYVSSRCSVIQDLTQTQSPSQLFFYSLKSQKGAAPFSFWLTLSIYFFILSHPSFSLPFFHLRTFSKFPEVKIPLEFQCWNSGVEIIYLYSFDGKSL